MTLGVGRGPEHGGDELLGLATPEAIVRCLLRPRREPAPAPQQARSPGETRSRHIDPADETKGTETLISLPKWICKVIRDL